jgi:hypothetical protein
VTLPCHLLLSWHLARQVSPDVKARRWVGWAGVVPDLDGIGLLVDFATRRTNLYEAWHHLAGHNFLLGVIVAGLAGIHCRSVRVAAWTWGCFHLHLLADLISGRGPDGSLWPIVYGWPLSPYEWQWEGQWKLQAWPNTVVFLTLLAWALWVAYRRARSPLELISTRLDHTVIAAFRSVWNSRGKKPDVV